MNITLWRWSGIWPFRKKKYTTYSGDGTVWHDIETGKRPGTMIESQLSELAWLEKQRERE